MWKRLALVAACWPLIGFAASGKVLHLEQEAWMTNEAGLQALAPGMDFNARTLRTGNTDDLQVEISDGTLIALPPNSEIHLTEQAGQLQLIEGGLRLSVQGKSTWTVITQGRHLRVQGYLKLASCGSDCPLPEGVYGISNGGETIVEYEGGRSVIRDKSFRLSNKSLRPEFLPRAPSILDDRPNHEAANSARKLALQHMIQGQEAFKSGDFDTAKTQFETVQAMSPGQSLLAYYLGLIALDQQDHQTALRLLEQYAKEDPAGALERDVPKTITLLTTHQLQEEVSQAIAQEQKLSTMPPEPNTIAVQTFASRGDPVYRAMAKGIAAIVIADLSKVPGLKVLEREKVQKLLDEIRLSESGLTENATAVKAGRMMRAERVVVGSFGVE